MTRILTVVVALLLAFGAGCVQDQRSPGPNSFTQQDGGGADAADAGDGGGGADLDAGADLGGDTARDVPTEPDIDLQPPDDWEQGAWIIGESVQNRPILAEQYGVEGPILFLMAAIHGNERSAVTLGEQVRAVLQGGLAERAGIRVVFLPAANPDGIAVSKRHNADDIDLNRNFPAENFDPSAGGGPVPLSEPESRTIKAAVDVAYPSAVITAHCCVPIMDYDGPARDLSAAMAAAMAPEYRYPVDRLGSLPGSFGSYVGLELDTPIITLEFALDGQMDTEGQLFNVERAIEAATTWVATNGTTPERAGISDLSVADSPLDAYLLTESAGGLPVRVESLVQGSGAPVLLLSGLVDNDRNALNVAEHIRRELYANVPDIPLVLLTAANPDGIETGSALDAAGDDVAQDLFDGSLDAPEAEAIDALFDSVAPRLVVHVGGAETDRVSSRGLSPQVLARAIPDQLEDAGEATGPLADWLDDRGIALVDFGVHEFYGRGDNEHDDFFAEGDPAIYSVLARRVIKPELACGLDSFCDETCDSDPDCGACACDFNPICEAAERGSDVACACDPDCSGGGEACSADARCDTWCPANVDPDCACNCDYNDGICEAASRDSSATCRCDADCADGHEACEADAHCDTWCPTGVDPDCG